MCAPRRVGAQGASASTRGRTEGARSQMSVGEQRVVPPCAPRDQGPQTAAATQYRQRLVCGAQPCGDRGPAFRLIAVEQYVGGALMPGQGQLPGQVLGVPQSLVEPLCTECAQQMGGVPGQKRPVDPPAQGEPVVQRVDARVQQLVRRCLAAPARQGVPDPGDQGVRGDELATRRRAASPAARRRPAAAVR